MSVRVEVENGGSRYWLTFDNHQSVHLVEGESWSDSECDCHCPGCGTEDNQCVCGNDLRSEWGDPIWPGTIDTEGLI
jgi:hypothetical protein